MFVWKSRQLSNFVLGFMQTYLYCYGFLANFLSFHCVFNTSGNLVLCYAVEMRLVGYQRPH